MVDSNQPNDGKMKVFLFCAAIIVVEELDLERK